jgi:hypothetical protein
MTNEEYMASLVPDPDTPEALIYARQVSMTDPTRAELKDETGLLRDYRDLKAHNPTAFRKELRELEKDYRMFKAKNGDAPGMLDVGHQEADRLVKELIADFERKEAERGRKNG